MALTALSGAPIGRSRSAPLAAPPAGAPASIIVNQIVPPDASPYTAWLSSWDRLPGSVRKLYGDGDLDAIVKSVVPQLFDRWRAFSRVIERVDFVRYALLFRDGGIYADADQELQDPAGMKALVDIGHVVLPFEAGGVWHSHQVGQALMVSPPRQPFWLDLMSHIVTHYNSSCSELLNTGPHAMTRFWNDRGGCASFPDVRLSRRLDGRIDDTYNASVTTHHSRGSWITSYEKHARRMSACKRPRTCTDCDATNACNLVG